MYNAHTENLSLPLSSVNVTAIMALRPNSYLRSIDDLELVILPNHSPSLCEILLRKKHAQRGPAPMASHCQLGHVSPNTYL